MQPECDLFRAYQLSAVSGTTCVCRFLYIPVPLTSRSICMILGCELDHAEHCNFFEGGCIRQCLFWYRCIWFSLTFSANGKSVCDVGEFADYVLLSYAVCRNHHHRINKVSISASSSAPSRDIPVKKSVACIRNLEMWTKPCIFGLCRYESMHSFPRGGKVLNCGPALIEKLLKATPQLHIGTIRDSFSIQKGSCFDAFISVIRLFLKVKG